MFGNSPAKAKPKAQPAERPKQAVMLAPNAAAAEALNKPTVPGAKPAPAPRQAVCFSILDDITLLIRHAGTVPAAR